MPSVSLPGADGRIRPYELRSRPVGRPASPPRFNRTAYAAAHVVSDPFREADPSNRAVIDWDATLRFRHHLWGLGFKVAEAMDTAQRGMGVDWPTAKELIRRSLREARAAPGADLACGAGTDQLAPDAARSLDDVITAYEEQVGFIEGEGGRPILMASRALARIARGPDDYLRVYERILSQTRGKVVLHWLGEAFDPQLAGYWGFSRVDEAIETVLGLIHAHRDRIEGIKMSLLDDAYEIALRDLLPEGVACFTGDDFNYAPLIEGDGEKHSHALLGIFDAIAPVASAALAALARGDAAGYRERIEPTIPLSRKIFEAPTRLYKAGIVFLAWLNGHQAHFTMPGGMQSARGFLHYSDVFRLADEANTLDDPELAARRMKSFLAVYGAG
ncbi:MAG TPA: dihydrodipicolinate synthase family protein [Mesorhizobium sp.]|jgi:hypothetical protein|nr:dihydrodipicolinate synthase family protein [Mesorhizobium sp.]